MRIWMDARMPRHRHTEGADLQWPQACAQFTYIRHSAWKEGPDGLSAPANTHAMPGDPPRRADNAIAREGQYSLGNILLIWAAAAFPMAVLSWVIAPAVGDRLDLGVGDANQEAFPRAGFLTLGLTWQFVLAMLIIRREEGDLRWTMIRWRCWLNTPRDPPRLAVAAIPERLVRHRRALDANGGFHRPRAWARARLRLADRATERAPGWQP